MKDTHLIHTDLAGALAERLGSPAEEASYLQQLALPAVQDVEGLTAARRDYGDSWRKRGGVGAFMNLARKWDRLEQMLANPPFTVTSGGRFPQFSRYDVFEAMLAEARGTRKGEGVIDAVRDLRRYLLLVEAHILCEVTMPLSRDNLAAKCIAEQIEADGSKSEGSPGAL